MALRIASLFALARTAAASDGVYHGFCQGVLTNCGASAWGGTACNDTEMTHTFRRKGIPNQNNIHGNTMNCFQTHLNYAGGGRVGSNATSPAALTHCPHALGGGPCAPSAAATAFCNDLVSNCSLGVQSAAFGPVITTLNNRSCTNFFDSLWAENGQISLNSEGERIGGDPIYNENGQISLEDTSYISRDTNAGETATMACLIKHLALVDAVDSAHCSHAVNVSAGPCAALAASKPSGAAGAAPPAAFAAAVVSYLATAY